MWDFYAKARTLDRVLLPGLTHPCDVELSPAAIRAEVPALADATRVMLVLSHECTDDRDYYLRAVTDALNEAWGGTPAFRITRFPVQWGIRVVTFSRR